MPRQRVLLCLLVNLSLFTALTWAQHYPPERQVDVTHVRIDVIPDFEHHTIAGSTKIDFTPLVEPLFDLILNAKDMEIIRITSDQPIEAWSYNDIDITVSFVSPIPVGQPTHVQIWHDAQPQKGIYFRTAKNGYTLLKTLISSVKARPTRHNTGIPTTTIPTTASPPR